MFGIKNDALLKNVLRSFIFDFAQKVRLEKEQVVHNLI